jgi:uncharacterized protein (TIGR03437 family)
MCDDMPAARRFGWNLFACLALATIAGAQTSSPTQPWAATAHWSASVMPGTLGPLAVDSTGDLLVANNLVGFKSPTKILGDTSQHFSWVSKVNASGTPEFGVQIGGGNSSLIAADSAGNVLIAGAESAAGLPVTPNAYGASPFGGQSAFACKLNAVDGTPILCTYLNLNRVYMAGIAADAQGNVYILAESATNPIVTTPGALSLGNRQVVLLKLNPSGQRLLYAAAFGGSGNDSPSALSVDADGNAYVMGLTTSKDFPGAAQGAIPTPSGSFIAKLDPTGSKILYASYGRAQETPVALAVDPTGAAYVSGITGTNHPYVRKYTSAGTALAYETVVAGTGGVSDVAVDSNGILTMLGNAGSVPFHLLTAACQALYEPYPAQPGDYMIRLASDGGILQSTFVPASVEPSTGVSILSTQPDHGWLAVTTGTGVGVIQIGPDSKPVSPVAIGCITNAASFLTGSIAPGEYISIFGTGLGPAAAQSFTPAPNGRVASTLGGVQVTFDGTPVPLLYVQAAQINAITPWALVGKSTTELCVVYDGNKSCVTPSVGAAAPGVFASGQGSAIAVNQNGTFNSSSNPAPFGSIVSLYLTGLGAISPAPADGAIVQAPLPALVNPIQVAFANADVQSPGIPPAELLYAGPAPLEVGGMFQINVRIPKGTSGQFAILSESPAGIYYCTAVVAVTP